MKILSLSEFIPAEICDTVRFNSYTGKRNISHYCGYASDYISQVLEDKTIDGAIYPRSCDSTRIISSYLSSADKFRYQLVVPVRSDEYAVDYFAEQLRDLRNAVENHYSVELGSVETRTNLLNERKHILATQYDRLEEISYKGYIDVIHNDLKRDLVGNSFTELKNIDVKKNKFSHRVYLVGSYLSNTNIAEIIESNGLGIVGDNLPESGRVKGNIVENTTADIFRAISSNILSRRMSPTQNNFEKILSTDIEEIKKLQIEAVIFISQKYCEPYDYLYSVYKKRLDELHIPSLHLSLLNSEDESRVALQVEAFADMI